MASRFIAACPSLYTAHRWHALCRSNDRPRYCIGTWDVCVPEVTSLLEASPDTKHHVRPKLANTCFQSEKSIDLAQPKQLGFNPMKWILHRIGRLTTVSSQQYASRHEPLMPADPHQAGSVPN